MQRSRVRSSNVRSVGYSATHASSTGSRLVRLGTLEVEFANSAIYQYADVPEQSYLDLLAVNKSGNSVGRYLHVAVKAKGYSYTRIA
jgi:hypothetical protein